MEENPSLAFAATISYFLTAIINGIMVVVKETNEGFEDWLRITFSHHWIGHGIILFIVFVVLTFLISFVYKVDEIDEKLNKLMVILILGGTLLSLIIIGGFFLANLPKEIAEVGEFILSL